MDHIQQYDWCAFQPEKYFLNETEIDNCVTEKILRNKFHDPMASSDEEVETKKTKINWDEVFSKKQTYNYNKKQINVPGIRMHPSYPKLSSLSNQQHYQCLKVLCAESPDLLITEFIPRATKQDHKVFQENKETYLKEQQEYKEWAKQQWITSHCLRALRPKPSIEMVYEAEYKVKAHAMQAFPKNYTLAAQIPLETNNMKCGIKLSEDIIKVDIEKLPKIQMPGMVTKKFIVMTPTAIPEPCNKHPCRFILPNEASMSILPLTEVHRELAQFGSDYDVTCVMSEAALRCVIEQGTQWELALSVCEVISDDGERANVIVISNEFCLEKQPSQIRSYRAYKHMLHGAMIPLAERRKQYKMQENQELTELTSKSNIKINNDEDISTDDEGEESLVIDTGEENNPIEPEYPETIDFDEEKDSQSQNKYATELSEENGKRDSEHNNETKNKSNESMFDESQIGIYSCTCKDTIFECPPPRSYKKWKVSNSSNKETYDLIIHCSHKMRDESTEVILEPIVEYQIDLGGSKQTEEKLTSLATSLLLRDNAKLINARIDGPTGELVCTSTFTLDELLSKHDISLEKVSNYLYTIINQLQGLLPGQYVLHHDKSLGNNAFLFAPKGPRGDHILELNFKSERSEQDEATLTRTAPEITDVLLPYHKYRKILPCAFTPFPSQVARDHKPITRQKAPPQAKLLDALAVNGGPPKRKWPKKNKGKKRKK